ncbi:nucleoside triphosphate pyrophosphohydrolase [Agaricicola taiwanensis]|uniref:Nucleoside triphosphate pyrophosphohydrolase n=1 Tax=Agaricicola taiwanensis TaxID=591372 RepID=A0A8J3DW17_9RHOB|nr:nucleoside triphosphate pyrophosphohydrolase [Agaricicola taiwanensis]GGE45491.1 nucleoside triphosphate pyrophosphohydrolase [Agaricicola taiwanensis]
MTSKPDIQRLLDIMAALRTPGSGCEWDLEQTFDTIAPYTLEEAAEVIDAIARCDRDDLKDELGDLLLQVVFHSRMAEEEGSFAFEDVVEAIVAKLVRRHPHVFGDARNLPSSEVKAIWNRIKAEEKAARTERRGQGVDTPPRLLEGVPSGLPALARAVALQQKAGEVGFDWNNARLVLAKIREELDEVEHTIDQSDRRAAEEEIGDLIFVVANLARHLHVDPELATRRANEKFIRRFNVIEEELKKKDVALAEASLDEMEELWQEAKRREKA